MPGTNNNRSPLANHFRRELVRSLRQQAAADPRTNRRLVKLPRWLSSPLHRLSASLLTAAVPLSAAIAARMVEG